MSGANQPWSWVQGLRRAFSQGHLRRARPHDSATSVDPSGAACCDTDSNDDDHAEDEPLIVTDAAGEAVGNGDAGSWRLVDGAVPTLFEICARVIMKDYRLVAQLYYSTPLR